MKEENLTQEEVTQLIDILPQNETGYRISILHRKYNSSYKSRIHSFSIFLDKNKSPAKMSWV